MLLLKAVTAKSQSNGFIRNLSNFEIPQFELLLPRRATDCRRSTLWLVVEGTVRAVGTGYCGAVVVLENFLEIRSPPVRRLRLSSCFFSTSITRADPPCPSVFSCCSTHSCNQDELVSFVVWRLPRLVAAQRVFRVVDLDRSIS